MWVWLELYLTPKRYSIRYLPRSNKEKLYCNIYISIWQHAANTLLVKEVHFLNEKALGEMGVGYSKNFYKGKLCPEVQPLTLLYTVLTEKEPLLCTVN